MASTAVKMDQIMADFVSQKKKKKTLFFQGGMEERWNVFKQFALGTTWAPLVVESSSVCSKEGETHSRMTPVILWYFRLGTMNVGDD